MNKDNPPETFGVFKPVGYTDITYRTLAELERCATTLAAHGFGPAKLTRYSPAEMLALIDAELKAASPLASFGYELDLIKANRVLALEGCHFLVVHAPDDTAAAQVADTARSSLATAAQHYGTFMIEDILESTPGST